MILSMPLTGIDSRSASQSQSILRNYCDDSEYDYELVEDIRGRMILHWNYRNLREIPPEVLNFGEHIEEVYLKRNCLEKLPSDIGKLSNLTNLYLVGNQLEELPGEIGDLRCLRVLDVSQNYIRRLPTRIGELGHLESLLLTYNQLEELPKCINDFFSLRNLHRLKQLELSGNRIHSLPHDVIQGLHSVEEFGVDRNPISSLPRTLCLLRNLRYFSACRCNLLLLPSMPFHSLLCKSNNLPALRRRLAGPSSRSNNNNNPQFLFDGNPRLNYVPYWVFQLLGSSVECFGCGLDPGESDNAANPPPNASLQLYTYHSEVNGIRVKLNFKGKRRTLHFDQDLMYLHHCGLNEGDQNQENTKEASGVAIATLFELCLRQVCQLGLLEDKLGSGLPTSSSAEPVIEPLIVPQRVGQPVINISGEGDGDLKKEKDADESEPEPESCKKTAMKSDKDDDDEAFLFRRSPSPEKDESRTTAAVQTDPEENKENPSLLLPYHISRTLMRGPVAKCFQCLSPIFTESWPIIFHIPGWVWDENNDRRGGADAVRAGEVNEDNNAREWEERRNREEAEGKLSIGCVHFCSDNCITRFRKGTKFSSNLLVNDLRCIVENEIEWVVIEV